MTANKIVLIIVVVVLVAALSITAIEIQEEAPAEEATFEKFKEVDELLIYLDKNGNANCQLIMQLLPSRLENVYEFLTLILGVETMEQSYIESIRGSFARYGLEVKNSSCEVTGLGAEENYTITMTWEIPCLARRENDRWVMGLEFVDNQSAVQEIIAQMEDSWVFVRNIAENARYELSQRTAFILPEGAENVDCPPLGTSLRIDYGGGSYENFSLLLEQVDGRTATVEYSQTLMIAENEMTLTPQQFLENDLTYTVSYSGVLPENVSFVSSIDQIRLDLKYGRELSERHLIADGESEYSLSPVQVLYYAADAIVTVNQDNQFSIQELILVESPENENGDWEACWKKISENEYVELAQEVRDSISSTNKAPGAVETSIGNIRFRDIFYTFTRILSSYGENGELPNELEFAPSPVDNLAQNGVEIPAKYAYFLLPDTYVITDSDRVNEILSEVYQPGYDNEEFAEELCYWTHDNITYTFIPTPPTSEEVLENKKGQCRDYANVYLALVRTAGIPARRISGWIISTGLWHPPAGWEFIIGTTPEGETIAGHAWTQVFLPDKGWASVDPTAGSFKYLPYTIYNKSEQTWLSALASYETEYGLI